MAMAPPVTARKDSSLKIFYNVETKYLFLCIPDPTQNFIMTLERLFFTFIWNNKLDKIKRNILFLDYKWGSENV